MENRNNHSTIWLLLILTIGAILRIYTGFFTPFSHDELSSLNRIGYEGFSQLIQLGVRPDGHPALLQVFLHYWSLVFGTSLYAIRTPFIVLGIFSIYISYITGKKWFNHKVGLLVALCIATMQFPLTYAIWARPYVIGLVLSLGLMYSFSLIVIHRNNNIKYWIIFGLCGILSMYNHYFSALFFILISFPFMVFLRVEKKWLKLLMLFGSLILLYTPHVSITIAQVSKSGLSWLGPPREDFLWQHIKYIFHYNPFYLLPILCGALFFKVKNTTSRFYKKQLLVLCLFIMPITIGYFYSKAISPVIQHSMLLFSLPAGLLFLFSWLKDVKTSLFYPILLIVLTLNIYSLHKRNHFHLLSNEVHAQFSTIPSSTSATILHTQNPIYTDRYAPHLQQTSAYYDSLPKLNQWRKTIKNLSHDTLLLCNIPLEYMRVAQEFYPSYTLYNSGHTFSTFQLTKEPQVTIPYQSILLDSNTQIKDEFEMTNKYQMENLISNRNQIIELCIEYANSDSTHAILVMELKKGNKQLDWRGYTINDACCSNDSIQKAYVYLYCNQYYKNRNEWHGQELSTYVWNPNKTTIQVKSLQLNILDGNPYQYGLFEDIVP